LISVARKDLAWSAGHGHYERFAFCPHCSISSSSASNRPELVARSGTAFFSDFGCRWRHRNELLVMAMIELVLVIAGASTRH